MESSLYIFSIIALGFFGMILGSFSSVLIYRWKTNTPGILTGRSQCPHCHNTLTSKELVPFFSYVLQGGKCAHCHTPISVFYPLLELCMGAWFMLLGYILISFNISPLSFEGSLILIYGFITAIYIVYDIRYMEIPDQALIPGIYIALVSLIVLFFIPGIYSPLLGTPGGDAYSILWNSLGGAWIMYTFFYFQILIPGGIYALRRKNYGLFVEILTGYVGFIIYILSFGYLQKHSSEEEEEIPTWIGGGDLRVALFIGLTLGVVHSISTLIFAYIIGSIYGIGYILVRKNRKAKIPFGPFLGIGWILSLLFYQNILYYINI